MPHATIRPETSPELQNRLARLCERTGDEGLARLRACTSPVDGSPIADEQTLHDWLSTCLMDVFKRTGDQEACAILYELNAEGFLHAIRARLPHYLRIDANDVLQNAFVNILRYPHRFDASRADAFRNWGHSIVRNTLFANIRTTQQRREQYVIDEALLPEADERTPGPAVVAQDHEFEETIEHARALYLALYLAHFERLGEKERRALTLVEAEGATYRTAAAEFGICVANFKMVVFRARRRIQRGMAESLAALERGEPAVAAAPLAKAG